MLEISLFGEQRVAVDGSVVSELGSPRAMALLGFLLLHRDAPQRREYIAAQFWPESTETQARTNLRRELHALRAGLPQASQWLAAEHGTLLWRLDGGSTAAAAWTSRTSRRPPNPRPRRSPPGTRPVSGRPPRPRCTPTGAS